MSTTSGMSTRRRRLISRKEHYASDPPDGTEPRRRTRSSSPWPRRLVLLGLALVILVWAAPIIVAATPLRDYLLGMALEPKQGKLVSASASLGWFSPVTLRGVEIRNPDPDAEPILTVETVTTNKTLLSLLMDRSKLGKIHLDHPVAQILVRSKTSNLEEFIAPWRDTDASSNPTPELDVEIADGALLLVDATTGRQWHLEKLQGKTSLGSESDNPLAVEVEATILDGMEQGRIQVDFSMPLAESKTTSGSKLHLQSQNLELVMLHGILARFLPDVQLSGTLNSDLNLAWGMAEHPSAMEIKGQLNIEQLLVMSRYLNGDRLELAHFEMPCHVAVEQNRLVVHEARLRCDLGQLEATGSVNLDTFRGEDVLASLASENYSIAGNLDLARLALALPNTLRVRENTAITSGTASLNLQSSTEAAGHRWKGQLQTRDLAAVSAGQNVAWEQPVAVDLVALRTAAGLTVEQLSCQSDFLKLAMSGTPDKLTGEATFDLTELMSKLEQFVDLGNWRVAGKGQAQIAWQQAPTGAFRAGIGLDLENFQLATPNSQPWQEPRLLVEASADGVWTGGQLRQLNTAEASVSAAPDELHAVLTSPVSEVASTLTWPLDLELKGNIPRWLTRLRPFYSFEGWQIDGEAALQTKLLASKAAVEVQQLTLRVDQFAYNGGGLFIREPVLELAGAGKWTQANRQLELGNSTLRGNDLTLETPGASLVLGDSSGPILHGKVHLVTSLERLHQYTLDPNEVNRLPDSWIITGRIDGTADLQHAGEETGVTLVVALQPLKVLQRGQGKAGRTINLERWSEPQLDVAVNAVYKRQSDLLQMNSAAIAGQSLAANATGRIENVMGEMLLALNGKVEYDLKKLMPLLEKYAGPGIALEGRESGTFALRGPALGIPNLHGDVLPWSQRLSGELTLGWQQSLVYGLTLGQGTATAALEKGVVRFQPIKVALSEGELTTTPVIQLSPEPAALYLPKGPLLTQVRLSPEFCDAWLKYAAPVVAEATNTEGKFSIDLDGGRIPLAAPSTGDIGGRVLLHSVQVMPGPIANNYILLGQQLEAILKRRVPPTALEGNQSALLGIADQTVNFRMTEGRVYHENLVASVAGTTLTTQGSVGLDQSLALNAKMPLADRWLGNEPALQAFKGQVMQVNIGGTLSKPAVDKRSVEQFAAQMVRGAVQNTIQNELSKQLDRFLPPKR